MTDFPDFVGQQDDSGSTNVLFDLQALREEVGRDCHKQIGPSSDPRIQSDCGQNSDLITRTLKIFRTMKENIVVKNCKEAVTGFPCSIEQCEMLDWTENLEKLYENLSLCKRDFICTLFSFSLSSTKVHQLQRKISKIENLFSD